MDYQEKSSAETLFAAVLDLPPERRAAFLDAGCRDAPGVRRLVEDLLVDHERAGSFLSEPAILPARDIARGDVSDPVYLRSGALLGRYRILEVLGSGGMGAVYRAQDENLQRAVAVKVLSPGLLVSEDARRRFHNEALALARLSHPHIAAVHDVGRQDGIDFLVMECVTGESLAARLKSGPLPVQDATSIVMQIAQALEEAHEHGVIHRDLKPANIMITTKGSVKVLDFGIAKLAAVEPHVAAGTGDAATLIGTPLYMSPEQVQGRQVDARTDLWSLGVVFYEMVTGRAPFEGEGGFAIMHAIMQESPVPASRLRPEVTPAIEQLIGMLLEKNPASRPRSAKDVVKDTSAALMRLDQPAAVSEEAASRQSSTKPISSRRAGSSRTLLWGSALAAGAIAAVMAVFGLHPKPPVTSNSVAVPLTTYQGSETLPSFSPDGDQVVFQWDGERQDNVDIYVKSLGADATPLRLTTNPAVDGWPSWSPDGLNIAFQREVAPHRLDLMLIPALGGPERKLAELATIGDSELFGITWSPDSRWLIVPNLVGEHMALLRVSVETGELIQITHSEGGSDDVGPSISPDGKTLLFNDRPTFYNWGKPKTVRLDENALPVESPHELNIGGLQVSTGTWLPGSMEIICRTPTGAVRLPAGGSDHPEPIPWLGTDARGIALSQRGNRLAYAVVRGDANIWRIDLTAKVAMPQRIIASTFRDAYPQYSPDGGRIAFQSMRTGDRSQVWISEADGSRPRQLTFVKQGLAASPHWSPDGGTLEFDSNVTGTYQIYVMSPDGGKIMQLTHGPSNGYDADWSRDGRWMYFASNRSGRAEVWKMPSGGGEPVQITYSGGARAIESLDGKTIYFSKQNGDGSIWKMPVEGGPEEELVASLHRDNFAVTQRGIYYMPAPSGDGTSTLRFYNFATGAATTLAPTGIPEYGLDLSPDGRYLAYAQLDDPASHLMLVEDFH